MDYGKILIYMYVPGKMIPDNFEKCSFDEFFRLLAIAQICRKMRQEDIEVGVNNGYVEAHQEQ